MSVSQFAVLETAASPKPCGLAHGRRLLHLVQPTGSKLWRSRYRFAGRESMLTFAAFPAISLASARSRGDEAGKLIGDGADPSVKRKPDKIAAVTAAQSIFEAVAAEYLANMEANGAAEATKSKNRWILENLAAPSATQQNAVVHADPWSSGKCRVKL